MNGEIAQAVALVCHGNALLRGLQVPEFWPVNSTAKFCEQIDFATIKPPHDNPREVVVSATPDAWLGRLKASGMVGLRLRHDSGQAGHARWQDAGALGGTGRWTIETLDADGFTWEWVARWRVGNPQAPDRRIWLVRYGAVSRNPTVPASGTLAEEEPALGAALEKILEFASAHAECRGFVGNFQRALAALRPGGPRAGYHQDLAPYGVISERAAATLDACQSAWVFGAMGSWNDLGFERDIEAVYEAATERLFATLIRSIVRAASQ